MQIGQDLKIVKNYPQIKLLCKIKNYIAVLGISDKQLELNGVAISTVKTIKKTIGAVGVAGCDFNFATAGNVTEQVIDLGAVIPALARILDVKTHTSAVFNSKTIATASRAVASNVATIVTAAAHGLVTGNSVVITGMTDTAYNGTVSVTVTNTTTFTFSLTHADETTTADTGGTVAPTLTLVAETGVSSSGNELIASATIKALNAITAQAHAASLNNAPSATAGHVYVTATPNLFWANVTAGKVDVYITYIETA